MYCPLECIHSLLTIFLFQSKGALVITVPDLKSPTGSAYKTHWDRGDYYSAEGAWKRVLEKSIQVSNDVCASLVGDQEHGSKRRPYIKELSEIYKGDVFFSSPSEAPPNDNGMSGVSKCIFVAVTDYVAQCNEEDGFVIFQNLVGETMDVSNKDVSTSKIHLFCLSKNEVCAFMAMTFAQHQPHVGIFKNSSFAINTLIAKRHWDERDVTAVPAEVQAANDAIKNLVHAVAAEYDSQAWQNSDRIGLGSFVIIKSGESEHSLGRVVCLESSQANIMGALTEVL